MNEFELISRYFSWATDSSVALGIGDDACLINIAPDKQLVSSVDTSIAGVHFPQDTSPEAISYKALAVNISDIAAMGAIPKWFTLALTLPEINEDWLAQFSSGLQTCAQQFNVNLVGGDTTSGELAVSITIFGEVAPGKALLRSAARAGDAIFVTGDLGAPAAALAHWNPDMDNSLATALTHPLPRLAESRMIASYANACIDISDGLIQDLVHVLEASRCNAEIDLSLLPVADTALKFESHGHALDMACYGGDDYELLFTVAENQLAPLLAAYNEARSGTPELVKITRIGSVFSGENTSSGMVMDQSGKRIPVKGYQHFS